jgi:hypothetical protein
VRKRGRLMAEFKQFKDKRRITSGDRGVLEMFLKTRMDSLLRDVALKRQDMTEQQMVKALESVQKRIDEDRELMLAGPSPSIRSLDAPLNQEDEKTTRHDQVSADESEVGGLFQLDTWMEVSTNPALRGVVLFIRDVYSHQADGEPNQGTELFMDSVPPVWQNYMLSLTSGDLTAEHIRKVNNDLKAAFVRGGYLNENNKIQFPPLSPAFLRHYSQPDSRTFWRTLMDLVRQAPQISVPRLPPPKVNPMPRAHVLYPRRTRYGGVNSGTMPVYLPEVPFTQFPNLFLSNPNGEMRSTTARFAGKCKLTGEPFASGDTIYKVEGVGWCSEAGAQMASEMGEAELAKHARQAAHSKHLSDSEIRTWEAMGGSMTSRGTPMMDRKFVSVADAKAMIADASGHAGQHYDTEGWGSVRRPSRRA